MGGGNAVDLLFDARHLHQSGIGTYIATELPYLEATVAKYGLRLAVLANPDSMPTVSDRTLVVPADPADAAMYSMAEQKVWSRALRAIRPRAIWVPHYPFPLALLSPSNRDTRLFVTVHDTLHIMARQITGQSFPHRVYANAMLTLDARRSTAIFTPSQSTAKTLLAARPSAPVRVTTLPIDEIWFSPIDPNLSPVDGRYVLYVGNTKWHKNLTLLIRAFEQVVEAVPHKLVIAGGGEAVRTVDERIAQLADRRPDRVVLTGRLEFPALRSLVAGADLLVMPSLHEGVGLPPLEAMASHTAVLASKIAALRETGGYGDEYFVPHDPRELADLIATYCSDDEGRAELAARGFAHVRERQSRISFTEASEAICTELGSPR